MERETRFELATSTLARLHSTTELFPLAQTNWKAREYNESPACCQQKNYGLSLHPLPPEKI